MSLQRHDTIRARIVLRYSALGDVVLATSVLEPLRRRFPHARIEWLFDVHRARAKMGRTYPQPTLLAAKAA